MSRITDVNQIYAGSEPRFTIELSKLHMMQALNWYTQNRASKDAEKYANDYFKKKLKIDVSEQIKNESSTFGFVCRIVTNGGILSDKDQTWFDGKINEIIESSKQAKKKTKIAETNQAIVTLTKNIQERLADKISEIIGELEGTVDDYISSGFKNQPSPYGIMHGMNVKGMHATKITEWAKKQRSEWDEVLTTKDKELIEGYSNFTKPQIKKMVAYYDLVITDCQKISGEAIQTRKPRKRKVKSPEELVAKLKFMTKYDDLKLVSIEAKHIIGALQLWVYNTKQRRLGCYHAEDAGGLNVKGSTIINFSESKSIQKRLRKPEVTLPEVLKGGKVVLRNLLDDIKAVDVPLTGRLNDDTILVRFIK